MQLLRFAIVSLGVESDERRVLPLRRDSTGVSVARSWSSGQEQRLLVCAQVALDVMPRIDDSRLVHIPESERGTCEAAIESAANLESVAFGCRRSISSPNLAVALLPETDDEKRDLANADGIYGADRGRAVGRLTVFVEEAALASLGDREEGVALIAEALSQKHLTGRYHELLRVFEQAFAESADRLVPLLAEFLAQRPKLGYTKTEVKRWLVRLRGPATHADRHTPVLEAGLSGVIDRMLLAAYEVVFNKQTWQSRDTIRRDVWTPTTGPLDAQGAWFVIQHRIEAPFEAQLYDPYGAYPLDLGAQSAEFNERVWPRSGPKEMTAGEHRISVVPPNELAIVKPRTARN
jgi:hypothetical protein